ncbi:MAG TPA: P-II family nitrogen regulator [Bacteroidales bacterium]|nr:P-II family nitrogen regulator [Bacteroidales bacterium]
MKAIMVIYNQAHTEKIEYMLDKLGIKGYSLWENVQGRGTSTGVPHLGTHAWPEINKSIITIVEDNIVDSILDTVKRIDEINDEVGIRAFVWDVLKTV